MLNKLNFFLMNYGEIFIGLAIGSLAHFGLRMEKEKVTWKKVIAYVLQLGFICLLAILVTMTFSIESPEVKMFIAATMAIAGRDAVEYARDKYKPMLDAAIAAKGKSKD